MRDHAYLVQGQQEQEQPQNLFTRTSRPPAEAVTALAVPEHQALALSCSMLLCTVHASYMLQP